MSMFDFGAFVLVVGIVARVTRLITTDRFPFGWLRTRIIRRFGNESLLAEGIRCDHCVSVWVAAATVAIALSPLGATLGFLAIGLVCLASWVTGFANQRT